MAVSSNPDRLAVVSNEVRLTTGELSEFGEGWAGVIAASGAQHVAYVGTGGVMLPLLIFSSARSGLAFTPINYRLSTEGIRSLIERLPDPLVVVDDRYREMVGDAGTVVMGSEEFLAAARIADPVGEFPDPDAVAIVLFTSGTTSKPKAVELSHNNLTSYVRALPSSNRPTRRTPHLSVCRRTTSPGLGRRCRTCTPDERWCTCPTSTRRNEYNWSATRASAPPPWCP